MFFVNQLLGIHRWISFGVKNFTWSCIKFKWKLLSPVKEITCQLNILNKKSSIKFQFDVNLHWSCWFYQVVTMLTLRSEMLHLIDLRILISYSSPTLITKSTFYIQSESTISGLLSFSFMSLWSPKAKRVDVGWFLITLQIPLA